MVTRVPVLRRHEAKPLPATMRDLPELLARIYVHRSITDPGELRRDLASLLLPETMAGTAAAAKLLAKAVDEQWHIVIVGDFDADGATSTAVAVKGLRALGAQHVRYLVPNRFLYGYGLTVPIVQQAHQMQAQLIITVDNGIASFDGVQQARDLGMHVLVTDHHLAADHLPVADVIVNPNVPGCEFASKSLAGVGVMFYVLLALRALLRSRGDKRGDISLGFLLDLVALGTIADVVPLDRNNRIMVHQGLQRIRSGVCSLGISALLTIAKRDRLQLTAADLAFSVAPRLNAAGRLDDMSRGIACLLEEDAGKAMGLAQTLETLNQERRAIEEEMLADADAFVQTKMLELGQLPAGLCLFDEIWHQGVIGLIAGRIKDRTHRPTICMAPGSGDELKGSARSIPGVHIRDVLADIANLHPELLQKFGGHAMAAGLTILRNDLSRFSELFAQEVDRHLQGTSPEPEILSDGELSVQQMNLDNARLLREAGPWGQHFPEPIFDGVFVIEQAQTVGGKHQRLRLSCQGESFNAIAFDAEKKGWRPGMRTVTMAYKLDMNHFREQVTLQLMVERIWA